MDPGDAAWVLASAALVLFMTPGLAFFYGGMDRSRNVLNMLMMNFWCLLIIPIVWVMVGFSLAYSGIGDGASATSTGPSSSASEHHRRSRRDDAAGRRSSSGCSR